MKGQGRVDKDRLQAASPNGTRFPKADRHLEMNRYSKSSAIVLKRYGC